MSKVVVIFSFRFSVLSPCFSFPFYHSSCIFFDSLSCFYARVPKPAKSPDASAHRWSRNRTSFDPFVKRWKLLQIFCNGFSSSTCLIDIWECANVCKIWPAISHNSPLHGWLTDCEVKVKKNVRQQQQRIDLLGKMLSSVISGACAAGRPRLGQKLGLGQKSSRVNHHASIHQWIIELTAIDDLRKWLSNARLASWRLVDSKPPPMDIDRPRKHGDWIRMNQREQCFKGLAWRHLCICQQKWMERWKWMKWNSYGDWQQHWAADWFLVLSASKNCWTYKCSFPAMKGYFNISLHSASR